MVVLCPFALLYQNVKYEDEIVYLFNLNQHQQKKLGKKLKNTPSLLVGFEKYREFSPGWFYESLDFNQ